MLMIKLCVFDMDGLLLDSERQIYAATGKAVSEELGRPISLQFLTAQMTMCWKLTEPIIPLKNTGRDTGKEPMISSLM